MITEDEKRDRKRQFNRGHCKTQSDHVFRSPLKCSKSSLNFATSHIIAWKQEMVHKTMCIKYYIWPQNEIAGFFDDYTDVTSQLFQLFNYNIVGKCFKSNVKSENLSWMMIGINGSSEEE